RVNAGGTPVRRDAADVPATPNSSGRADRPGVVVRFAVLDPRAAEPTARESHRLAVVHGLADRVRGRRRARRHAGITYDDTREPGVRTARRRRGARIDCSSRRRRHTPVNAVRYHHVLVVLSMTVVVGCGSAPGQPHKSAETLTPNEVLEFATLYDENCAA